MPVSWIVVEVFAVVLFFMAMAHAARQENSAQKIFELFGFILAAAIFENIGVNVSKNYFYDLRRIVMVGSVPMEILMLEAVIWYAAFQLVAQLNLPMWARPFAVGLFGTVQDMTIDPAHVFDRYSLVGTEGLELLNETYPGAFGSGTMSGQWNWTNPGYEGGWFGIPVYNISGWFTLMAFFTVFALLGRWIYQKTSNKGFGFAYPFLSGVFAVVGIASPLNVFLLYGTFNIAQHSIVGEVVMVCVNLSFAIALLVVFRKRMVPINVKEDGLIIFGVPIILHLFDIIYAFAMGTNIAYVPVLLIACIHFAYLFVVYRGNMKLRKLGAAEAIGSSS